MRLLLLLPILVLLACVADPSPPPEIRLDLYGDRVVDVSGLRLVVIQGNSTDTSTVTLAHARDLQELWVHDDTTWEVHVADAVGGLTLEPFQTAHLIYDAQVAQWYWVVEGK